METPKTTPGPRRGAILLIGGIALGLLIGAGSAVLFLHNMRRPQPLPVPSNVVAVKPAEPTAPERGPAPTEKPAPIPVTVAAPDTLSGAAAGPASKSSAPTPTPLNPFNGPIQFEPTASLLPQPVAQPKRPDVRLIEVSVPESQGDAVKALIGKANGRAREITDYRGESATPMPALLALVPPVKTQALVDALMKMGAIPGNDWHGSPEDRDQQLSEHGRSLLSDLRIKRQDLLVRYYEDAQPVKALDDQIAEVTDTLAKVRTKSDPSDAVKILLTPN